MELYLNFIIFFTQFFDEPDEPLFEKDYTSKSVKNKEKNSLNK